MLTLSEKGDNSTVDMLVGDICKLICLGLKNMKFMLLSQMGRTTIKLGSSRQP